MKTHTVQLNDYPMIDRVRDAISIIVFFVLEAVLLYRIWPGVTLHPFWTMGLALFAYLGADFVSGFVHWLGDTWGTMQTPYFGRAFIRPFREHHVDPEAITRHDFVETNGANCFVSLFALIAVLLLPVSTGGFVFGFSVWMFFFTLGIFATNQFHKWAHDKDANAVIKLLQKWHVILGPSHHRVHHTKPYDQYYCITTGWMNAFLVKVHFYKGMEYLITHVTGAKPRQEDTMHF